MDSAAFATWRAEIGFLTAAQRGLAYFDLALAEADDPIERRDDEIGETAQPDEKAGAAVARIVEEKPQAELLSKVGAIGSRGFVDSEFHRDHDRRQPIGDRSWTSGIGCAASVSANTRRCSAKTKSTLRFCPS